MSENAAPSNKLKIRCRCGARMALPRAAAGRTVKCPKCATKLRVPAPHEVAPQPALAPDSAKAERIVVACACGAKLRVGADAAGKKARCPKCGAAHVVRAPAQASVEAIAAPALIEPEPTADEDFYSFARSDEAERGEAIEVPKPASIEEYDERAAQTCPACAKALPPSAKICVACGIDIKTGRGILMVDDAHLDAVYERTEATIRVVSWLIWVSLIPIPIGSEAFGTYKPWVVRGIALFTTLVSIWFFVVQWDDPHAFHHLQQWDGDCPITVAEVLALSGYTETELLTSEREEIESYIATMPQGEFRWYQPFTAALLHGDIFHLLGNLIFLFAFGAAVNKALGPWWTIGLYPLFALAAGLSEHAARADGYLHPSLGASGAIYGMAGLYVVLFPISKVHMVAWIRWGLIGGFHLSMKIWAMRGFWFLFFMIAWDAFDTIRGAQDNVAHWAHLGGFMAGFATGLLLLLSRLVNGRGTDIISVTLGRHAWKILGKPKQVAA
ncbi:MAG: rhomboid family intramembrane serine protease [Phycisphaerae bacterium]